MLAENTNVVNIELNQKSSFEVLLNVFDQAANAYLDLTTFTANSGYTTDLGSNDPTSIIPINAQIGNSVAGEIRLSLSSSDTSMMDPFMKYFYDVTITDNNTAYKTRIIQGTIKVNAGVS